MNQKLCKYAGHNSEFYFIFYFFIFLFYFFIFLFLFLHIILNSCTYQPD